jgi:hypothetical protein
MGGKGGGRIGRCELHAHEERGETDKGGYRGATLWKYLPYETNKVRLLVHELRDEFKSVSDGYNCYHILTDDKGDDTKLYFI